MNEGRVKHRNINSRERGRKRDEAGVVVIDTERTTTTECPKVVFSVTN